MCTFNETGVRYKTRYTQGTRYTKSQIGLCMFSLAGAWPTHPSKG